MHSRHTLKRLNNETFSPHSNDNSYGEEKNGMHKNGLNPSFPPLNEINYKFINSFKIIISLCYAHVNDGKSQKRITTIESDLGKSTSKGWERK